MFQSKVWGHKNEALACADSLCQAGQALTHCKLLTASLKLHQSSRGGTHIFYKGTSSECFQKWEHLWNTWPTASAERSCNLGLDFSRELCLKMGISQPQLQDAQLEAQSRNWHSNQRRWVSRLTLPAAPNVLFSWMWALCHFCNSLENPSRWSLHRVSGGSRHLHPELREFSYFAFSLCSQEKDNTF